MESIMLSTCGPWNTIGRTGGGCRTHLFLSLPRKKGINFCKCNFLKVKTHLWGARCNSSPGDRNPLQHASIPVGTSLAAGRFAGSAAWIHCYALGCTEEEEEEEDEGRQPDPGSLRGAEKPQEEIRALRQRDTSRQLGETKGRSVKKEATVCSRRPHLTAGTRRVRTSRPENGRGE